MKRVISIYLSIACVCLAGVFVGCSKTDSQGAETSAQANDTIWTCSMHPQIQQSDPGDCPICGMDLIPLKSGAAANPRELELSDAAQALADIQTATIKRESVTRDVHLFGVIAADDTRVATVTARFPGRIERLFVNFVGTRVRAGEHLAEIYSDELVEAQSELIGALRYDTNASSAEGIKERLRLWDIPEDQIELIDSTRKPVYRVRIDSPTGGIVTQLDVREGDYVNTGARLFEVTDLTKLWVHFNAYETDLPWLRYGQQVDIQAKAFPGEHFQGTIAFIQPILDPETRTIKVRVNMDNPDGKLRPGMFVRGQVKAYLGDGGKVVAPQFAGKWIGPMHPEIVSDEPGDCPICGMALEPAEQLGYAAYNEGEPPLIVPASAVLRTGKRAVVYIKDGPSNFIGREIELGPRAGDYFVVREGLTEGEEVVTNGAFRLDSELQIKAKPSMMNPSGDPMPMAGHNHGTHRQAAPASDAAEPIDIYSLHKTIPLQFDVDQKLSDALSSALQSYFALESSFDKNDFSAAKEQAATLANNIKDIPMMGLSDEAMPIFMQDQADGLSGAQTIAQDPEKDRINAFEATSESLIALVQIFKWPGDEPLYLMHCPMVHGDHGARWLQTTPEVTNPYFGPDMLECGEILAKWNPDASRWDDYE
ncbi:efflux RND transporter periplasmic adaptor subunit [Cerasicoccus fimbriatus]|uniref:efflux RND transporter periplasmic adaptor subunit n=1 Tax=Cerasicoccus fimbriatus TaxID=3014554 RepID=UPI0022B2C3A4|nr:efflux RND transporter periplasmic adaptor subunit [Cerasicoccus sp. TK19100]